MTHFATPAILLRRRVYGDFDLILTMLTRDYGKCTMIAKAAKKSKKRFAGVLEPFTGLQIVYGLNPGRGMPVLEEASLEHSYSTIRADIVKTGYAGYWAELIDLWLETGQVHGDIFHLLAFVLEELDQGATLPAFLNILFQMRFVGEEGFRPVLERCASCDMDVEKIHQQHFSVDLKRGGIVCRKCPSDSCGPMQLSKGTLKQMQWLISGDLSVAKRVRFSSGGIAEATAFLEAFVPYHIGKVPKSLGFLHQVRPQRA